MILDIEAFLNNIRDGDDTIIIRVSIFHRTRWHRSAGGYDLAAGLRVMRISAYMLKEEG